MENSRIKNVLIKIIAALIILFILAIPFIFPLFFPYLQQNRQHGHLREQLEYICAGIKSYYAILSFVMFALSISTYLYFKKRQSRGDKSNWHLLAIPFFISGLILLIMYFSSETLLAIFGNGQMSNCKFTDIGDI